jgi:predicted heme/steroid binding protein
MTSSLETLMSVPVRRVPRPLVGSALISHTDYGLLLNRCELARYDGCTDELPALIGYRGRVYDVTGRSPSNGQFSWLHYAGRDCTAELRRHPRRDSLLTDLPCVGVLED